MSTHVRSSIYFFDVCTVSSSANGVLLRNKQCLPRSAVFTCCDNIYGYTAQGSTKK